MHLSDKEPSMRQQLRDDRSGSVCSKPTAGVEDLAAALTEAAYPVALRKNGGKRWLELQLDLWHAMQHTVQKWQQ